MKKHTYSVYYIYLEVFRTYAFFNNLNKLQILKRKRI